MTMIEQLKTEFQSVLNKLKAGKDYGPGGTVLISTSEAALLYRILTERFGVKHDRV